MRRGGEWGWSLGGTKKCKESYKGVDLVYACSMEGVWDVVKVKRGFEGASLDFGDLKEFFEDVA